MAELISISEALARVLARVRPLPPEPVALPDSAGRVLAEPARALVDLPPFPSSAMDGFAVRAADTPGTLPVGHRIAAGRPVPRALGPGEAMAIATGGAIPDGADAVVPMEYVVEHANSVEIATASRPGDHVRPRAGDVRAGEVVVETGSLLGPAQLGGLAAAGISEVRCARRPQAAVLATGSELCAPGEPLGPGQIYESNSTLLASALSSAGAEVERLPSVEDDPGLHRAALARGLEHDVLVTSGGVSVGAHDLVRGIERELGVEEVFWGVAVKPGKPVSFGVRGATLVFGLPGNPVSALVGFELFVRPALLALQGAARPGPRYESGRLVRALRRSPQRDELVRARSRSGEDGVTLDPIGGQESHMIVRAAGADALVLVPRGEGELAQGEQVRFLRLA